MRTSSADSRRRISRMRTSQERRRRRCLCGIQQCERLQYVTLFQAVGFLSIPLKICFFCFAGVATDSTRTSGSVVHTTDSPDAHFAQHRAAQRTATCRPATHRQLKVRPGSLFLFPLKWLAFCFILQCQNIQPQNATQKIAPRPDPAPHQRRFVLFVLHSAGQFFG